MQNKNIHLQIENYSKCFLTDTLMQCIDLLPDKYKILNTKIFIFETHKDYIFYCLKHFKFKSALICLMQLIIYKTTLNCNLGSYSREKKEILIIENCCLHIILHEIYANNLNIENVKKYIPGWIRFILLDVLLHELTHAIQDKENGTKIPLKYLFQKWSEKTSEIDCVTTTIDIMTLNYDKFIKIINAKEINISHTLNPLKIEYTIFP